MSPLAWETDPNLHNPTFVHGYEALILFCLAGTIVACWLTWKDGK